MGLPLLVGFSLLLCACESDYVTVIRNDSGAPMAVRLSKKTTDTNEVDGINEYKGMVEGADTCCAFDARAGFLTISCRVQPNREIWVGNEMKMFDFGSPLDWDSITVETREKKITVVTSNTVAGLISERTQRTSCGDCGPPTRANIISIQ